MNKAVPDCLVSGYESLIDGLQLPDQNDRHVLAATIRSGSQAIVTWNLKDFPQVDLAPYGIEAVSPDEFILDLLELAAGRVIASVIEQAKSLKDG